MDRLSATRELIKDIAHISDWPVSRMPPGLGRVASAFSPEFLHGLLQPLNQLLLNIPTNASTVFLIPPLPSIDKRSVALSRYHGVDSSIPQAGARPSPEGPHRVFHHSSFRHCTSDIERDRQAQAKELLQGYHGCRILRLLGHLVACAAAVARRGIYSSNRRSRPRGQETDDYEIARVAQDAHSCWKRQLQEH